MGFADPRLMTGRFHQLNYENLLGDMNRKKWFTRFSYCIATVWVFFLMSVTLLQGLKSGHQFTIGFVFALPAFYLDQWAFAAVFAFSTGSILGLIHMIGKSLFDTTGVMHTNMQMMMNHLSSSPPTAASSPSIAETPGGQAPH